MKRLIVAVVIAMPVGVSAEPVIGTSIDVGETLARGEGSRVGLSVYAVNAQVGGWLLGGELDGGIESYLGGYGCGTVPVKPGTAAPAVAVSCLEPSLSAHVILGRGAQLGQRWLARAEVGVGATAVFLVPAQGGEHRSAIRSSALARGSLMVSIGQRLGGAWRTGVQVTERIVDGRAPRAAVSIGWVLEATVID